ncbi:MAG: hypothetical protein RBT11_02390 [Desulfobacterales bacterium]|jgi:hypothetical protein|nr:hypothetical protein [Desulfobacterales bacterium]
MRLQSCVAPTGEFFYGVHQPEYVVENFRKTDAVMALGKTSNGRVLNNTANFPAGAVPVANAEHVYEVPNAFPFRGTTYILKKWADQKARAPYSIGLPKPPHISFSQSLKDGLKEKEIAVHFKVLPYPLQLALAATSTDPEDLKQLAALCCDVILDSETHQPMGLRYESTGNVMRPVIYDQTLFEVLANNFYLPTAYKEAMVLRPGAQGGSEIVGESRSPDGQSHVWEYLRANSYIPWGHFAANMAQDCIRYRIEDLSLSDMTGMRQLYYQRTYSRMAKGLGIDIPATRRALTPVELETLRQKIADKMIVPDSEELPFTGTLWGWNFGFDYAPSRYRLHASHQQIHQQFALLPGRMRRALSTENEEAALFSYACGDQIQAFCQDYYHQTGKPFFDTYIRAIRNNTRMDANPSGERSLIVYEDAHCMLFVPKAQTSQWELNLMTLAPVGNILETATQTRASLDHAMLTAVKALSALGAQMITIFEYAKRFDAADSDQRLLYVFLPRLPESPGAFSEAQLRWINGHYPEDFAVACRAAT